MRMFALFVLFALSATAWGEACVVHAKDERLAVKLCQQNRSVPSNLFREGFCEPQLAGPEVQVEFVESCPMGAYGICRDAQVSGLYKQDIHYYGVATDAAYLKPYCERQNRGVWMQQR